MANLKNLEKAIFGPHHTAITVGNNRTIEHVGDGMHDCRLHGHRVARIKCTKTGYAKVTLDTCGFRSVTTRAAMSDFLSAFGIRGNVSFAGGKFWACWWMDGDDRKEKESIDNAETLTFMAQRYDV